MSSLRRKLLFCGSLILTYLIFGIYSQASACPNPPSISNGRLRPGSPYQHGDVAAYDCVDGYSIVGSQTAKCFINTTYTGFDAADFPPSCVPTPPTSKTTTNNLGGIPEWLTIIIAVFITLFFLMLLACMGLAVWYMCCRGAASGLGNSAVNPMPNNPPHQAQSSSITNKQTTMTRHDGQPMHNEQMRMRDAGNIPPGGDYYRNYPNSQGPPADYYPNYPHNQGPPGWQSWHQ